MLKSLAQRIPNNLCEAVKKIKEIEANNDDFYWRQKSSSLNVVQYNTTSRPIIIHLQVYIAKPENLINRATLEYVSGLTLLVRFRSNSLRPETYSNVAWLIIFSGYAI